MTIRFDVALIVLAVVLAATHHYIGCGICLGILWLHKYG